MKKITLFILFILSISWIYFYHKIVLNNDEFQKEYWLKINVKNDYRHYFYYQNYDPLYVFKKELLDKYSKYSFENKKSNLLYPNQELIADINYIQNIQYAASYINPYQAKYLYANFNYITNLSPYWEDIYKLWNLLLPANRINKNLNFIEKLANWKKTVKFWEKWIFFTCNKNKIDNILKLKDKDYIKLAYSKTWAFYKQNSNPCKSVDLPEWVWFNYFYYLKDLKNWIKYYKVAWFQKEALPWVIWMVSVINWLLWEHEKSMYMLIQKAIWINDKLKQKWISSKLAKTLKWTLENTIKRAEEELNFYIISTASKNHSNCNKDYDCLVKNWYIKSEIINLINTCKKENILNKIKTFDDLINKNIDTSLENSKCFLLNISLQKWLIKKWKLYSSMLKWWKYFYDTDYQRWWVWIFNK